jgi:hypothetical protein
VTPFAPEKEEEERVAYIRSILRRFKADPKARERVAVEEPDLYRFLNDHPGYWEILDRGQE